MLNGNCSVLNNTVKAFMSILTGKAITSIISISSHEGIPSQILPLISSLRLCYSKQPKGVRTTSKTWRCQYAHSAAANSKVFKMAGYKRIPRTFNQQDELKAAKRDNVPGPVPLRCTRSGYRCEECKSYPIIYTTLIIIILDQSSGGGLTKSFDTVDKSSTANLSYSFITASDRCLIKRSNFDN
ncbi:hypothetical protein GQX74_006541 [Glossina fuscipes]|nr:hypothetical protein GQX74_006541 [Glossina fuscipes]